MQILTLPVSRSSSCVLSIRSSTTNFQYALILTLQALQYSMSFFDAEKSGTLTANDITWRGNSALTDAVNGSSLVGGFYDGANGMSSLVSKPLNIAWHRCTVHE